MRSSRVENLGVSGPLCYIVMSPWYRFPIEPSFVGAVGSDRTSGSGSEVSSLVDFLLGGTGFKVGLAEGGSLRDSRVLFSSIL